MPNGTQVAWERGSAHGGCPPAEVTNGPTLAIATFTAARGLWLSEEEK